MLTKQQEKIIPAVYESKTPSSYFRVKLGKWQFNEILQLECSKVPSLRINVVCL